MDYKTNLSFFQYAKNLRRNHTQEALRSEPKNFVWSLFVFVETWKKTCQFWKVVCESFKKQFCAGEKLEQMKQEIWKIEWILISKNFLQVKFNRLHWTFSLRTYTTL